MRLLAIRPANFRAFGACDWIPLDCDLVACSGANGTGKTSLAEAIEWLLFGRTRRRERGDALSKLEYKGSYANLHAQGPVEVSARVRLADGAVCTLSRRLVVAPSGAENSLTFVDGGRQEFTALGIPRGADYYPIITQHGLQDFIHAGPKERRDAFSAMLGLEALSAYKTALDRARYSFQRSVSPEVAAAHSVLADVRAKLSAHPSTSDLARHWDDDFRSVAFAVDWPALIAAAQREMGTDQTDPNRLIGRLEHRRGEVAEAVFDLKCLRPQPDLQARIRAIRLLREELGEVLPELVAGVEKLAAMEEGRLPAELLAFWQAGLRIAEQGNSAACPMCKQPTFTEDKRQFLTMRLSKHRARICAEQELLKVLRNLEGKTAALGDQLAAIVPRDPRQGGTDALRDVAPKCAASLASYCENWESAQASWSAAIASISDCGQRLEQLAGALRDRGKMVEQVEQLRSGAMDEVLRRSLEALENAEALAAEAAEVERQLSGVLSSSAEARRIDALVAGLRARSHILAASAFNEVREASLAESRAIEEFIQAKQGMMLSRLEFVVRGYYELMNPESRVRFSGLEPARNSTRLLAESFGEEMSAAACLSTSQLNCLGLAIHLVRATRSGSPFGFLILDDPFQAMDDERCENLIAAVLPRLLDRAKKQVIVLTHRPELAARAREVHAGRKPLHYRIETSDRWARVRPEIAVEVGQKVPS